MPGGRPPKRKRSNQFTCHHDERSTQTQLIPESEPSNTEPPVAELSVSVTPAVSRPTRIAKLQCIERISNVSEEERNCHIEEQRVRASCRRINETEEERDHRLEEERFRSSCRRINETEEQRDHRLEENRLRSSCRRINETEEERDHRLEEERLRSSCRRINETEEQRDHRLEEKRLRSSCRRMNETEEERDNRLEDERLRSSCRRINETGEERDNRLEEERLRSSCRRINETEEQRDHRLEEERLRSSCRRINETEEERDHRLEEERLRSSCRRINETEEERDRRLGGELLRASCRRMNESEEERNRRLEQERFRVLNRRNNEIEEQQNRRREEDRRRHARIRRVSAANHLPTYKTATTADVVYSSLGPFNVKCIHDGALHFPEERVTNQTNINSFGDCCLHGRILQTPTTFPNELALLFVRQHPLSSEFHSRIRNIDACFALSSFNVADDRTFNNRGIYSFTACGLIYHKMNVAAQPALDAAGNTEQPRYGQMYFLDANEAVAERTNHPISGGINQDLLKLLEKIMRDQNPFVRGFMMMREVVDEANQLSIASGIVPPKVHMLITAREGDDPRRFNSSTFNEVAAVITLNADQSFPENEMVVRERGKDIITLKNTDSRIEPFSYPLFYPQGNFGWSVGQLLQRPYPSRLSMTRLEFAQHRLAFRPNHAKPLPVDCAGTDLDLRLVTFNALHFGGRLFQQYVVDTYIRVERDRILFIKNNQKKLMAESYAGVSRMLNDLAAKQDATIGAKVILPSSFPGSTRFYTEHFEDAMAIVRRHGSPDYFITVTCNPEWPELRQAAQIELGNGNIVQQLAQDRPDLVARIAKLKFGHIVDDIMKKQILGRATAYVYTIEFQKRGLPHMHLLIIMARDDKIQSAEEIDDIICAEIPENDEELRQLVLKWMTHNPCGEHNNKAPCMVVKNGRYKCRFGYPMEHQEFTSLVDDKKPKYRRRYIPTLDPHNEEFSHDQAVYRKDSQGRRVTRDNRHVAPYNGYMLKKYNCHINVEYVGSIRAVKYLYKYIYKGHDCARIKITENGKQIMYNEAETYVETRYISPPEACWRLFGFEIQKKSHSVQRLAIHLKGHYRPINMAQPEEDLTDIGQKGSTLEAYFHHNASMKEKERQGDPVNYYYYWQMPEHYRWIGKDSKWQERLRCSNCIGRIHTVCLIAQPELYFLRMLLFHVHNATSFNDLYFVNGVHHATYKQACLARGLTYDDQQWIEGLIESASSKMPRAMRTLFAQILILGSPEDPKRLWEMFKYELAEDFIHEARNKVNCIEEGINQAYRIIAYKLNNEATEGRNFKYWVTQFGMDDIEQYDNPINPELFEADESTSLGERMYLRMNEKQREIVDAIMFALDNQQHTAKCFFVDGPGGTGKTFVYICLYHLIRGKLRTVKCMAFTGIAAINLPEGRTSHKTFGLQVPLTFESISSIKPGSEKANELSSIDVFMLDEAPMLPKYGLENMDQLLRVIEQNNVPFGGKIMVLGGDFRQCLPVQTRANKSEILDLSIKRSNLWLNFTIFTLDQNMRLDREEEEFAKFLINLGDGTLPTNEMGEIEFQEDVVSNGNLIEEVYGICFSMGDYEAMAKRAILAPLNKDVDNINNKIIDMLPGEEKIYASFDTVKDQPDGALQFTTEFLNSINIADLPPHKLKLKINSIIMLLRNLDVSEGMCNGTRLIVTEMCNNLIKAKIITGEMAGREVHIPRITLDSSKSQLGCTMQRHQFPVRAAFAMTIHKSQGQTLEFVGVNLLSPVFMHGMLYVACSRVKRKSGLKVHLPPENARCSRNIVWTEVLNNTRTVSYN